jgi:xanthine/CO dehydrogenase XdhC/CoxF family maturation factor
MSASNKEIANILAAIAEAGEGHPELALATVVDVEGSSYRRSGARMLIRHNGTWVGAISGGCLEGNVLRRAREVMRTGAPQLITYDTRTDEAARIVGASLGCNGLVRVWIEPLQGFGALPALERLQAAFQGKAAAWFARLIEGGSAVLGPLGTLHQLDAADAHPALTGLTLMEGLQTLDMGGDLQSWAVEHVQPALRLLIFGAGDDVRPLASLAAQMGWRVEITDECAAKCLPVRFPEAGQVRQLLSGTAVADLAPDAYTAAVLISHNYDYDKAVLSQLLGYPLCYIGILGPRKRFERLDAELGGVLADLPTVHAPIGLDIGANTPFEIALAIVAEIQAVKAGRSAGPLRARAREIHDRLVVP